MSIVLLFMALGCLFWFNFATTRQSFIWMIGEPVLVTVLAVAISLIDIAGVYMVTVGVSRSKDVIDDVFYWLLLLAWVLSTLSDLVLTYFWGSMMIFDSPALKLGRIDEKMIILLPGVIAISEFGMRIPLVISLGRLLAKGFYKIVSSSRGFQPGSPVTQNPMRPAPRNFVPINTQGASHGPNQGHRPPNYTQNQQP